MSWRELEARAHDLARAGRERLEASGVALLGTLRPDGWPRISPVEPFFVKGDLVFGVMPSPKLDDLTADPRCVLHSAVADGSGTEAELKLYGRALMTADPEILAERSAWWASRPPDRVAVFALQIDEAVLVAWDPDFNRMRVNRWVRDGGTREAERDYP